MMPIEIISQFDKFLKAHAEKFSGVAIGGTALNLLGVISRETRDCDILSPEISDPIARLAKTFAKNLRAQGEVLQDDWLNNGPASLKKTLPPGWQRRLQPLFAGQALSLQTLARPDLLKVKLFAFCDRGTDRLDCLALRPTKEELLSALDWVKEQDANPDWPRHVETALASLGKELGYDL